MLCEQETSIRGTGSVWINENHVVFRILCPPETNCPSLSGHRPDDFPRWFDDRFFVLSK
jgi:hypothetical protein